MPLFTKGHIRLKREALVNIILDENLREKEQNFFIRIVCLAWPYDFTLRISDGHRERAIELHRGELYGTVTDLMRLASTTRKFTMLEMLKNLNQFQYIDYMPRRSKYEEIFLKIRDYDYYIETTVTESVTVGDEMPTVTESVTVPLSTVTESVTVGKTIDTESVSVPRLTDTKTVTVKQDKSSDTKENQVLKNNKEYVVKNKQQQGNVVVEIQSLFKKKGKRKLPKEVCENLIRRFGYERVVQNIKRLKFDKSDNPPGYLIASLEEGWELPLSEEEKIEAEQQARDEEEKRRQEELKRVQQEALPPEKALEKVGLIRSLLRIG